MKFSFPYTQDTLSTRALNVFFNDAGTDKISLHMMQASHQISDTGTAASAWILPTKEAEVRRS